jgi:hypothetical protein
MSKSIPPKVRKLAAAKQQRLDSLLEKNAAGSLSDAERTKLTALVDEAEQLMVENARRLGCSAGI